MSGTYPKNKNEILVEERLLKENNLKIGDILKIEDDVFDNSEFKIVGTVSTSTHFNNATATHFRGNTNIGTGEINYYTYVLDSNFNLDYYTNIFIVVNNKEQVGSKEYNKLISKYQNKLNKLKSKREKSRYDEIYTEAYNKVKDEETKANKELKDYNEQLENAKEKIVYTIDFTLTKDKKGDWSVDNLTTEQVNKLSTPMGCFFVAQSGRKG